MKNLFSFFVNIQSRPTATLYEKKRGGKLEALNRGIANFFLVGGNMQIVVVSVGSFIFGSANSNFSLLNSLLKLVIIPVGSFALGNGTNNFSLFSSLLKLVIIPVGSFSLGNGTNNFALVSGEMVLRAFVVSTPSNSAITSYALQTSTLV